MAKRRKIIVPIELVELEKENYHIVVQSVLSNGEKADWIVDTGASRSVFDINLRQHYEEMQYDLTEIQSAGIGNAQIETLLGQIDTIRFGELEIKNLDIALIDLNHVNSIYSKISDYTIAGLLGSDILVKHKAVISYKDKFIGFYSS